MTARMSTFPTALKALVGVIFAALFFFGLQAPAAYAAGEVDLTVKLTTKAGTALSRVTIYAYQTQNHGAKPYAPVVESVQTTAGRYLLSGLDAGQAYALYFDALPSTTTAFDQFYGGTTWIEEAQTLTWSADATLDVSLATNSSITGSVKGTSNAALSGVTVYPIRFDGSAWYELYSKRVTTSSSGAYAIRNLEPGSYKIAFAPSNTSGYLPEFSGDVPDESSASPVYVGLGATATSNATLAKGGTIVGTVELLVSGTQEETPSDVVAYAYPWTVAGIDTSRVYLSKPTTSTGKWTVAGLPPGTYKVKLYDLLGIYPPEWATDKTTVGTANKYTIVGTETNTTPGTSTLERDSSDRTVVLDITHDGAPIADENATVYIESAEGEDFFSYVTPQDTAAGEGLANGRLTLPEVKNGTYEVTIDSGMEGVAPSVTIQTKVTGATDWDIALADASAFTFNTAPTLNVGGTTFGSTLSVTPSTTSLDPVEYSYIWLRDGEPVYGSTGATYTVRSSDAGHQISVLVRAEKSGYPPLVQPLVGPTIPQGAAPVNVTPPSVTAPASPVSGSTLTGHEGTWNLDPLSYLLEWKDGTNSLLGTGATYKVKPTDAGTTITLWVTASGSGRSSAAAVPSSSSVTVGYLDQPVVKSSPKVTSKKTGSNTKYTVTKGSWTPTATAVSFVFFVDGVDVATNTSGVFTCTPAICPAASVVDVTVRASYPGSQLGSKYLLLKKATAPSIAPSLVTPGKVSDTTGAIPTLGSATLVDAFHVLTVTPPVYSYATEPGALKRTYTWEWSADGNAPWTTIAGATSSTYSPDAAQIGRSLRVSVTTTSANFGAYVDLAPIAAGKVRLNQQLTVGGMPWVDLQGNGYVNRTFIAKLGGASPVVGVDYEFVWHLCDANTLPCSNFGGAVNSDWTEVARDVATFYVPADKIGWKVMAGYEATKSGYAAGIKQASPYPLIAEGAGAPFPMIAPTVSGLVNGKAAVGKLLTSTPGVWDSSSAVIQPHWEYCPAGSTCTSSGWLWIDGTFGSTTYTPSAGLVDISNGQIRFSEVGILTPYFNPNPSATIALQPATLKQTKAASFKKVGPKWEVKPGTWTSGTTFSYAWYVGDTLQGSEITSKFPVTSTGPVYVKITAHKSGYTDVVKRLVVLKGTPTTVVVGITPTTFDSGPIGLTAPIYSFGMAAPEPSYKYQWYYGTKAISGAKSATYTPASNYVGKALKLKVTLSSPLYATTTKYSTPSVLTAHPAPSGTAVIESTFGAGTYATGATLSVAKTGFPSGSTFTYTWERSDDGVTGWAPIGTMSTYTLAAADVSKYIRVTVIGKKTGWVTSPGVASNAVQSLIGSAAEPVGQIALKAPTGSPRVGTPLTVDATFDLPGATVTYTWYRNDVVLAGVSGPTWTPLSGSLNDEVRVVVDVTKPGHSGASFSTHTVSIGLGSAPTASTKPTVTGMTGSGSPKAPKVGDVLKPTPGVWNVDGLTFTYQWTIGGVDVSSAADGSRTVDIADVGKKITVTVTAHRVGWNDGESTSVETKTVAAP